MKLFEENPVRISCGSEKDENALVTICSRLENANFRGKWAIDILTTAETDGA